MGTKTAQRFELSLSTFNTLTDEGGRQWGFAPSQVQLSTEAALHFVQRCHQFVCQTQGLHNEYNFNLNHNFSAEAILKKQRREFRNHHLTACLHVHVQLFATRSKRTLPGAAKCNQGASPLKVDHYTNTLA